MRNLAYLKGQSLQFKCVKGALLKIMLKEIFMKLSKHKCKHQTS